MAGYGKLFGDLSKPVDTRTFQQYDKSNATAQRQIGSSSVGALLPNNPYQKQALEKILMNVNAAMTDPMMVGSTGIYSKLKQAPLEDMLLYHGTNSKNVENILKEGLKTPEHMAHSAQWYTTIDNLDGAKSYGDSVVQIKIPKDKAAELLWPGEYLDTYKGNVYALKNGLIPPEFISKLE